MPSKLPVALCGKHIRKLNQAVIPFAGIVYPQNGGAKSLRDVLPDGKGHGDPGADAVGAVDQNGTSVMGGGGTDQYHPQAQAQAVLCEYAQRSVLGDMIAGKILGQEPAFREASGLFWMDMTCACQEMIARQRPAELFEGEDTND